MTATPATPATPPCSTPAEPRTAVLAPHPDFPAPSVDGITVTVAATTAGGLRLDYRLTGDLAALRVPTAASPVEPDRLWAHTCFEVFLTRGEGLAYREYNFSPSGQWAGYGFAAYRQRDAAILPVPVCDWRAFPGELALTVTLPAKALPTGDGPLRLALTTVVELADGAPGTLSYWALAHPAGKPDFHHRDGFVLALPDL